MCEQTQGSSTPRCMDYNMDKDRARSMALDLAEDFNTATAAGAERESLL